MSDSVDDPPYLRSAIRDNWILGPVTIESLPGGMNSRTWKVTTRAEQPQRRWVAKVVPTRQRESFTRGLAAASRVEMAGIPAGAADITSTGELTIELCDGVLALLRWVNGQSLHGTDAHEQVLMGTTLGRAHRALGDELPTRTALDTFPAWVELDAGHLDVEDWVRPAIQRSLARFSEFAMTPLTYGLLHGDPAPEAFLWATDHSHCGLIDWSSATHGPMLYDVASAVLYLGGLARAGTFLRAYERTGPLSGAELTNGIPILLQVRWAVQADYFARRLAIDDRTGISNPRENLSGLHDAGRFFGLVW